MPRALVIGYGNSLRGDDSFGCRVAERLAADPEISADPSVDVRIFHQLLPELAEAAAGAELVIFIDAAVAAPGISPGTLQCKEISAEPGASEALGHCFTPARVIEYAGALFGARPRALLIFVASASFDLAETLSPAVEAAVPAAIERVRMALK